MNPEANFPANPEEKKSSATNQEELKKDEVQANDAIKTESTENFENKDQFENAVGVDEHRRPLPPRE